MATDYSKHIFKELEQATACAQKSPAQYKLATRYLQDTAFGKQ